MVYLQTIFDGENIMKYIEFPYGNEERIILLNGSFYLWKKERIIKSDLNTILLNLANYYNINITKFAKHCYEKFGGYN